MLEHRIVKMGALLIAAILLCATLWVRSEVAESNLVFQDLNSADWDIANLNGSINLSAGPLPVMVLEALVNAGLMDQGDPLAG